MVSVQPRRRFSVRAGKGLLALGMTLALMASPAWAAPSVDAFVKSLWPQAQARGVPRAVFDAAFAGFTPSAKVMELTRTQPEFSQTMGAYIAKRVTDAQTATGRRQAGEWAQTLGGIEQRYGVNRQTVLAIWGMETNFGGFMGGNNTIHALATLTHGGYRADYFRGELLTALQILAAGHVRPSDMVGSWAGAMGHTQFMPTSFAKYAVDYNGDGRADIWNSVPDALGSTANYLREHGWRPGEAWGYEVQLPANFDYARAWGMGKVPIQTWQAMGVKRVADRQFPRPSDMARLLMPAGGQGPAFLVLPNFEVIKRYNNSDSYALAVGHLADRIIGSGNFVNRFPADDVALNKTQRQEVQTLLNRRGYNVGTADGVFGPRTRAAIIAFQRQNGLLADGHPSAKMLARLR